MNEDQPFSSQSPFDYQGLYFPDKGRTSALTDLKKGISESVSLSTCIGEEGTGKTVLRRMLEKEYATSFLVISFPSSVESFDYVLQVIALKLNLEGSQDNSATGGGHLLLEITQALREQKKHLLILFDEAEKLYLATLERIRKMIDLTNEEGVVLQVVLFGRMGLQSNIEQLSLCTFKNIEELHITLPILDEEETFQYLNFCMQNHPGFSGKTNIFSREVAAKILDVSRGNFKKINALAWDSLQSSSYRANDPSFMVLLEHVRDSDGSESRQKIPVQKKPFNFSFNKKIIAAGALLALVSLFFFSVTNNSQHISSPNHHKTKLPLSPGKTDKPDNHLLPPAPPVVQPSTQDILQSTSKPDTELKAAPPAPPPAPATTATSLPLQPEQTAAVPAIQEPPSPSPAVTTEKTPPVSTEQTVSTHNTPTPAPETSPPAPEHSVSSGSSPDSSVAIAPLVEKKTTTPLVLHAEKEAKKFPIVPLLSAEQPVKNKIAVLAKGTISPFQLPRKNLATGESWLSGKKDDIYTVQLMVLTGDQASEKLTEILNKPEHKSKVDDFIILKKETSPSTLILFFGEYPTRAAAREALNQLPPSLQKYNPYTVSVKQAVNKAK